GSARVLRDHSASSAPASPARERAASNSRAHGPALGSRARPRRAPHRAGAAGQAPSSAGRSSVPGAPAPPPEAVHCQESWLAFASCPSCPASLAAVIVVQTVSRETGSDLASTSCPAVLGSNAKPPIEGPISKRRPRCATLFTRSILYFSCWPAAASKACTLTGIPP